MPDASQPGSGTRRGKWNEHFKSKPELRGCNSRPRLTLSVRFSVCDAHDTGHSVGPLKVSSLSLTDGNPRPRFILFQRFPFHPSFYRHHLCLSCLFLSALRLLISNSPFSKSFPTEREAMGDHTQTEMSASPVTLLPSRVHPPLDLDHCLWPHPHG